MRNARRRAFTMVELLVVIAIIGVLSVVAVNIYGRYSKKAKTSEAMTMLAHIKAKQEVYMGEHYRYAHIPSYWPGTVAMNARTNVQPLPVEWQQLGLQPGAAQVYFQYNVVSDQGDPTQVAPANKGLTAGQPWFVARAQGCFDDQSGTPDTFFEIVSNRDTVWKIDKFGNRGP